MTTEDMLKGIITNYWQYLLILEGIILTLGAVQDWDLLFAPKDVLLASPTGRLIRRGLCAFVGVVSIGIGIWGFFAA